MISVRDKHQLTFVLPILFQLPPRQVRKKHSFSIMKRFLYYNQQ